MVRISSLPCAAGPTGAARPGTRRRGATQRAAAAGAGPSCVPLKVPTRSKLRAAPPECRHYRHSAPAAPVATRSGARSGALELGRANQAFSGRTADGSGACERSGSASWQGRTDISHGRSEFDYVARCASCDCQRWWQLGRCLVGTEQRRKPSEASGDFNHSAAGNGPQGVEREPRECGRILCALAATWGTEAMGALIWRRRAVGQPCVGALRLSAAPPRRTGQR